MRILILSRSYPFPPDTGDNRRIAAIVSGLAERDHSVELLALQEQGKDPEVLGQDQQKLWQEKLFAYRSRPYMTALRSTLQDYTYHEAKFRSLDLKQAVDRVLTKEKYDVVMVNFLTMSRYLDGWLKNPGEKAGQRPLFVLDQHNLDEIVWQRHLEFSDNIIRKNYTRNQLDKVKRLQRIWLPQYDVVFSVSQSDLERTKPYIGSNTSQFLVPNGVDIDYFQPFMRKKEADSPPVLVFVAAMDIRMNQEAANWFARDIFPLVRSTHPDAQFWIVGRDPSMNIQRLSKKPGIWVTGTVPDVREYYSKADICVVPLRMGGGTKLKTLEAMAVGLPVVSTSVGVQGLDVVNEAHYRLGDDAPSFAQQINEILGEQNQAEKMVIEARKQVCERYSWQSIVAGVEQDLLNLIHLSDKCEKVESGNFRQKA